MGGVLIPLTYDDCITLLATHDTGRIAVLQDDFPVAFPLNYRVVELEGEKVLAIRTRTGNAVDHVDERVGFEIDGVDPGHDGGWSVVVRGRLRAVSAGADVDSFPVITSHRDAWRVIVPTSITGRRVVADPMRWSFNPAAYL
jgi:hypothetical protein